MKVGSMLKLKGNFRTLAAEHGWLWVYEGIGEYGDHSFQAVATGFVGHSGNPCLGFENWDEDDNN